MPTARCCWRRPSAGSAANMRSAPPPSRPTRTIISPCELRRGSRWRCFGGGMTWLGSGRARICSALAFMSTGGSTDCPRGAGRLWSSCRPVVGPVERSSAAQQAGLAAQESKSPRRFAVLAMLSTNAEIVEREAVANSRALDRIRAGVHPAISGSERSTVHALRLSRRARRWRTALRAAPRRAAANAAESSGCSPALPRRADASPPGSGRSGRRAARRPGRGLARLHDARTQAARWSTMRWRLRSGFSPAVAKLMRDSRLPTVLGEQACCGAVRLGGARNLAVDFANSFAALAGLKRGDTSGSQVPVVSRIVKTPALADAGRGGADPDRRAPR